MIIFWLHLIDEMKKRKQQRLPGKQILSYVLSTKLYVTRNNNKVDSIEIRHKVTAYLLT